MNNLTPDIIEARQAQALETMQVLYKHMLMATHYDEMNRQERGEKTCIRIPAAPTLLGRIRDTFGVQPPAEIVPTRKVEYYVVPREPLIEKAGKVDFSVSLEINGFNGAYPNDPMRAAEMFMSLDWDKDVTDRKSPVIFNPNNFAFRANFYNASGKGMLGLGGVKFGKETGHGAEYPASKHPHGLAKEMAEGFLDAAMPFVAGHSDSSRRVPLRREYPFLGAYVDARTRMTQEGPLQYANTPPRPAIVTRERTML